MTDATTLIASPATIYYAAAGTALPDETTVDYGEAWGGSWTNLGETNAPVTAMYDQTLFELSTDQSTAPVDVRIDSEEVTFQVVLSDVTPANLVLALGGTASTTAAGAGQRGFTALSLGGNVLKTAYIWGIEGFKVDSSANQWPVRLYIWKGVARLDDSLTFSRREQAGVALNIRALRDTSKTAGQQLFKIEYVTAAATDE